MAIIHELLYRSKNLSTIKIREYLQELVSYISQTYNLHGQTKVELKLDINEESIDLNKAIPCGIIINELLSNAFKYAFPNNKKGNIVVEFVRTGKKHYNIFSIYLNIHLHIKSCFISLHLQNASKYKYKF